MCFCGSTPLARVPEEKDVLPWAPVFSNRSDGSRRHLRGQCLAPPPACGGLTCRLQPAVCQVVCVYVSVCPWALFATPRVDLASRAQTLAGKDDLTVRASDFIQSAQRYQRRGAYCRTSPPPFRGQNPGEYLAVWWSFYVSHVTGQEQK